MQDRFAEQVAIVTGGADGLGKGVAERIAEEGGKVCLFDVNRDKLDATQAEFAERGLQVDTAVVNIGDENNVKTSIADVCSRHGQLDIMVNCAGIVGPTNTKIADYDYDAYMQVIQVNLVGSYLMTKYALEPMLSRGYGRILLYASIAGKEGNPGMCGYSSSKAGVLGLVKAIGKEYAESGVTINGLAPAVIRTAMVDACSPEQVKYMTDKIPMRRTGEISEAASISTWIVSRESSFCTGFVFDLSGGRATY